MSKISDFYKTTQNEALTVLESVFDATECPLDDQDFPLDITSKEKWIVRKISTHISDNKLIDLVVAIPPTYPDNLPKIYLSKSAFEELSPLPNVDNNRFICTRDAEVVFLNDAKPGEAILELVQIAIQEILLPGIEGTDRPNIDSEFLAYWADTCKHRFISSLSPPKDICLLKAYQLKSKVFDSSYFVTDDLQRVKNWLIPIKVDIEEKPPWNVLNLHLPEPLPFPLPSTNAAIFQFIKKCGRKYVRALAKFIKSDENNLIVFFSHEIDSQVIWYGLKFRPWPAYLLHGFTKLSKVPLKVRIAKTASESFEPIYVERVDRERLFDRIGLRLEGKERIQICLIGCGSVGSSIAYSLAKSGFDSFTLIDNDVLHIENIARHECGAIEARNSPPKVNALQSRLLSHFPYLSCQAGY